MSEYTAHHNLRTFWGHFLLAECKKIFGLLVSRLTGQKGLLQFWQSKDWWKKETSCHLTLTSTLSIRRSIWARHLGHVTPWTGKKTTAAQSCVWRSIKSTLGTIQMTLKMLTAAEDKTGFWLVKLFLRPGLVSY